MIKVLLRPIHPDKEPFRNIQEWWISARVRSHSESTTHFTWRELAEKVPGTDGSMTEAFIANAASYVMACLHTHSRWHPGDSYPGFRETW